METLTLSEYNRNQAYFNHPTKQSQCAKVKALLSAVSTGLTIGELSRMLELPKSTISGRINDLKPSVVENGSRYDETSNTNVTVWKWMGEQQLLFTDEKKTPAKKLKLIQQMCIELPCELSEKIIGVIG